jgi:hypothetical protein
MEEKKKEEAPVASSETPDAKERIGKFVEAYGALVKEHGIDFASYPVFVPDGKGSFKIIIQSQPVDIANQGVKSPEEFIPAE